MVEELHKTDFQTIACDLPGYPDRLTHCHDAPPLLFVKGNADLGAPRTVSVVGTRSATNYGRKFTRELVEFLKPYGATVISGLAIGIDAAAHRAALDMNMPTWAVLAHGFDRIYPFVNRHMAREMLENGGWITEFLPFSKPDRENFPRRNRIIAGLCDVCVVIEAARKGGALITAELANSYGRDVMALPGRVNDPVSLGCNSLIRTHKAHLIERPQNLVELLNWEPAKEARQLKLAIELTPAQEKVHNIIPKEGCISLDALNEKLKTEVSVLLGTLLHLEMKGLIRNTGGHQYIRND